VEVVVDALAEVVAFKFSSSATCSTAELTTWANGNPLKLKLRNLRKDRTEDRMSGEEDMDTNDALLLLVLLLLLPEGGSCAEGVVVGSMSSCRRNAMDLRPG
jgi:hypothetical protein